MCSKPPLGGGLGTLCAAKVAVHGSVPYQPKLSFSADVANASFLKTDGVNRAIYTRKNKTRLK